jgi:hypothetical protein
VRTGGDGKVVARTGATAKRWRESGATTKWWRQLLSERRACGPHEAVRKRSLTGGPTQFGIFPIFQKQLEIVNSKQTSFGAPKILKLCMMVDLSILSNFFNWVDFEFPTQFML